MSKEEKIESEQQQGEAHGPVKTRKGQQESGGVRVGLKQQRLTPPRMRTTKKERQGTSQAAAAANNSAQIRTSCTRQKMGLTRMRRRERAKIQVVMPNERPPAAQTNEMLCRGPMREAVERHSHKGTEQQRKATEKNGEQACDGKHAPCLTATYEEEKVKARGETTRNERHDQPL